MKKILFIVSVFGLSAFSGVQVLASSTPNLQVKIFPLECSLDTVALGNANLLQLTPEDCLPEVAEPFMHILPPQSSEASSSVV
jgi:hypothetical protein